MSQDEASHASSTLLFPHKKSLTYSPSPTRLNIAICTDILPLRQRQRENLLYQFENKTQFPMFSYGYEKKRDNFFPVSLNNCIYFHIPFLNSISHLIELLITARELAVSKQK